MARGVAPEFVGGAAVAVLQSWFCTVACGTALHAAAILRRGQRSCSAAAPVLRRAGAAPWRCCAVAVLVALRN